MVLSLANPAPEAVSVVDDAHRLVSDTERLRKLLNEGFAFEACAAQALVVEAMCMMYLLLRKQAYRVDVIDHKGRAVEIGPGTTFGRTVGLLISSDALHDGALESQLKEYVRLRNSLVHEIAGTSLSFDFQSFFAIGVRIVSLMKPHFTETLAKVNAHIQAKNG